MKRLGALAVIFVLSLLTLGQSRHENASTQNPLIGAWRLASLEEPDADGRLHKADCTGMLVFTRDGHVSVQVMYANPPSEDKSAPVQYAQGGYEASYGKYDINDAHTFTFHVEGALVRKLVGKDLKRAYELSGNQLLVKSSDQNERWRVTWERYNHE